MQLENKTKQTLSSIVFEKQLLRALEVERSANVSAFESNGARTRKQSKDGGDRMTSGGQKKHVCTDKMRRHITRRVRTFQKAADRAQRSS